MIRLSLSVLAYSENRLKFEVLLIIDVIGVHIGDSLASGSPIRFRVNKPMANW